ncbi:unnamed protein product [Coregonus sp. 'balchen']|nr:unnamed protein product [Coregonus sp. 'balchen']
MFSSVSCEVRPGPEFITRSYLFHHNHTFQVLQFHYWDNRCSSRTYTLLTRGKLHLRQASWVVRGGTEADYQLHSVQVVFHSPEATMDLSQWLKPSCGPLSLGGGEKWEPWEPHVSYDLWSEEEQGRDCADRLCFTMNELQLVRVERRRRHGVWLPDDHTEELFLGDVHTERPEDPPHTLQLPAATAEHQGQGVRGRRARGARAWSRTSTPPMAVPPHTEYELFRIERDSANRLLLFNGQRPTDASSPNQPHKTATSYQAPLVQCAGAGHGPEERRETDELQRLWSSCCRHGGGGGGVGDMVRLLLIASIPTLHLR